MSSRRHSTGEIGRDTPATVAHARSIIEKIEGRQPSGAAAIGDSLRAEAKRYAQQAVGNIQAVTTAGEKVEAAYIAGATRDFDPQDRAEDAQILIEELYGPGEPEDWKLANARTALARLAERRVTR